MYEALVEWQMRSLDRPYVYMEVSINRLQMQSLSRTCSRRHLKLSQGLIKSWSVKRRLRIQLGRLSTLIKQPNDQLQQVIAD